MPQLDPVTFAFFSQAVLTTADPQQLLLGYLSLPNQDPEWVTFVRSHLGTTSPEHFGSVVKSFLNLEGSSWLKNMIVQVYQNIFYAHESPQLFIPARDLDLVIRSTFELLNLDFNTHALSETLNSLCTEGPQSRFYSDVLESNGFEIVWKKEQGELLIKLQREAQALELFQLKERALDFASQRELLLTGNSL
jgi:hypothetical protein